MLALQNEESFATIIYQKGTNFIIKIYDYVNFSWYKPQSKSMRPMPDKN